MTFDEALQLLKQQKAPGIVHILSRDRQLGKLIAVWPMMTHRRTTSRRLPEIPDSLNPVDIREALWTAYALDRAHACSELRAFLGATYPAGEKLGQAMKCGMILPGGLVHDIADRMINNESAQILKGQQPKSGTNRNV